MEFSFNVSDLLKDEITTVDSNLQPCKPTGINRHGFQHLQNMLYEIVDKMGAASAKAQGLPSSITTGKKLALAGHRLYIMKDREANGGKGAVLGILKVGTKKLFVYDRAKVQHELDPLCVLDFYVHESRQRMGCGRQLFDFMLSREGVRPPHLAIDRPSPKFSSFLRKHYKLSGTIPQVNNFVIFDGFFSNRNDLGGNRRRAIGSNAHIHSPMGNGPRMDSGGYGNSRVSHSPSPQEVRGQYSGKRQTPLSDLQNGNLHGIHPSTSSPPAHDGSRAAGEMMYSRHGPSPPHSGYNQNRHGPSPPHSGYHQSRHGPSPPHSGYHQNHRGPTPPHSGARGRQSPGAVLYKNASDRASPHLYNTNYHPHNGHQPCTQHSSRLYRDPSQPIPSTHTYGHTTGMAEHTTTLISDPRFPRNGPSMVQPLPDISSLPQSLPNGVQLVAHRPPSGKRTNLSKTESSNPPLVPRGPPPKEYTDFLNMHQAYQSRGGHLTVPARLPASLGPDPSLQKASPSINPPNLDTSWTVTGVLRDQRLNGRYNSTRLW